MKSKASLSQKKKNYERGEKQLNLTSKSISYITWCTLKCGLLTLLVKNNLNIKYRWLVSSYKKKKEKLLE